MIPYHHMSNMLSAPEYCARWIPTALRTAIAIPSSARPALTIPNSFGWIVGATAAPLSTSNDREVPHDRRGIEMLAALGLVALTARGQGDDDEHQPDQRRRRRADDQIEIFPAFEHARRHSRSRLAPHRPDERGQAADQRRQRDQKAGSRTSMTMRLRGRAPCSLFVPYSNRKMPTLHLRGCLALQRPLR